MAITNKPTVPNPAIFTSDPTEQILTKGMLDSDTGGLAYLMMHNAKTQRDDGRAAYMSGVREANVMSAKLAQQELMQDQMKEILKGSVDLMGKGFAPRGMRAAGQIFGDPMSADANDMPAAMLQKVLSEANKNNAEGAAASANAGDKYEVKVDNTGSGVATSTYTGKGRDPTGLQAEIARRIAAENALRGLKTDPSRPMALPASRADAETAAKARYPGVR